MIVSYRRYKDRSFRNLRSLSNWFLWTQFLLIVAFFVLLWFYPLDIITELTFIFVFFFSNIVLCVYMFYLKEIIYLCKKNPILKVLISPEVLLLLSISVLSVILLITCGHSFIKVYTFIELQSMCSVLLAFNLKGGLTGGLIYYILSAIGSGCLLFGMGFIYFTTGCEEFVDLFNFIHSSSSVLEPWNYRILMCGYILIVCGIFIKLGAIAPFHLWMSEVYKTANTYIMPFFASIPILGLFSCLLNLNMVFGEIFLSNLNFFYYGLSIIGVFIGTVGAIYQDNLKKIFVYSSISNIGFIICLFPHVDSKSYGIIVFFITIYILIAFCFWTILTVFEYGLNLNIKDIKDLSKLYHSGRYPKLYSICFLIFLLSSIGIPPLLGFFGKYFLFFYLVGQGNYLLLLYFIIMSCWSAYYFLRVVITVVLSDDDKKDYFYYKRPHSVVNLSIIFAALFHICFFFVMSYLEVEANVVSLSLFFFYTYI